MVVMGLPDDRRLRKYVTDTTRAGLMRTAREGTVWRIFDQPDQGWELAG
jgi:hypothetical protein